MGLNIIAVLIPVGYRIELHVVLTNIEQLCILYGVKLNWNVRHVISYAQLTCNYNRVDVDGLCFQWFESVPSFIY